MKIRGGQEARQHESCEAGEQADDDQNAADDLERAGQTHEGKNFDAIGKVFSGRKIEILRRSMLKKEQSGHDAQRGMKVT